jgi:hypothetical protein
VFPWRPTAFEREGRPEDDKLVFPGETKSGYLNNKTVLYRELYPAMEAAEIPRVGRTGEKRTFHSFRHTFAKRALENGRGHVVVASPWALVPVGDDRDLWALRAGRAEAGGGADGGRVRCLVASASQSSAAPEVLDEVLIELEQEPS